MPVPGSFQLPRRDLNSTQLLAELGSKNAFRHPLRELRWHPTISAPATSRFQQCCTGGASGIRWRTPTLSRIGGQRQEVGALSASYVDEEQGTEELDKVTEGRRGRRKRIASVSATGEEDDEGVEEGYDSESGIPKMVEHRLVSGERVLQISKADFTVSSVLDKIRRGRLDLRPSYQRDYVWDKRTASKLIESVLLNIPLPTMFFHEKSQGHLEVVDGKQRLTSIWCFMESEKFPDGTDFALVGLEVLDKLNGKKYSGLDEPLREVMQDFALNVHTISRHSDDDVVFEVFERLNMGSTQLNEQELRNCVFQGRYNNLLEELVLHPAMLKAFRQEIPHKRMRDREFVLRFFALRRGGTENFFVPVKNWLNNEMRSNQLLSANEAQKMKADFVRCITASVSVFGDQVFRLPRGGQRYELDPNVCLWDTVMCGFLGYEDIRWILNRKEALVSALDELLTEDAEFKGNLLSNVRALKARTKMWSQMHLASTDKQQYSAAEFRRRFLERQKYWAA